VPHAESPAREEGPAIERTSAEGRGRAFERLERREAGAREPPRSERDRIAAANVRRARPSRAA
jgi:hypothetical protein